MDKINVFFYGQDDRTGHRCSSCYDPSDERVFVLLTPVSEKEVKELLVEQAQEMAEHFHMGKALKNISDIGLYWTEGGQTWCPIDDPEEIYTTTEGGLVGAYVDLGNIVIDDLFDPEQLTEILYRKAEATRIEREKIDAENAKRVRRQKLAQLNTLLKEYGEEFGFKPLTPDQVGT